MNSEQKTVVVTGGTSGIGAALVTHFAGAGWRVVFTGRNREAAAALSASLPGTDLHFLETDFGRFETVKAAAIEIRERFGPVDVLINNAGTWEMVFRETAGGIETNFAVNHLAPMLFTLTLLPGVRHDSGRIITMSSGAHRRNILDLEDPEWRHKPYDGVATYSQSKLCNLLFTHRLARETAGTGLAVNAVHPGFVKTGLFNNMAARNWDGVPDAAEGARGAIHAATEPTLAGQSDRYFYRESDDPNRSPLARNSELADRLWDLSLRYLAPFLPS